MSLAFILATLLVVASPGTGAVLTIGAGIRAGRGAALITAVGCTLGVLPHLLLALSGASAVVYAGGPAFLVLKVAGVAYLGYQAWSTWRGHALPGSSQDGDGVDGRSDPVGRTVRDALLANLLNPKLTVFFFAFLPQFVTASGSAATRQMLGLGAVFMAVTLVVFAAYGLAACAARNHLLSRPAAMRRLQKAFSLGYAALAVRLAVA